MIVNSSTERFSDRVANYINYRPSYPLETVATLVSECGLSNQSKIADIGSGTGIYSRLLVDKNFQVTGVEPNESMRRAAEQLFTQCKNFISVEGQSEHTGLPDQSIDLIIAAQAFHWFRYRETKQEFTRILKPGGHVALIWNQRKLEQPFQKDYDKLLREFATDYNKVNHMNISCEDIEKFFCPNKVSTFEFENSQLFDLNGFLGRMLSSSYTPKAHTREQLMLVEAAETLFNNYKQDGTITFEYSTRLYLAPFSSS